MQELIQEVWSDPRFHELAARLQRALIAQEIGVAIPDAPSVAELGRTVQAAAILACSPKVGHRLVAFRTATSAYELAGATELPLDQAVRVVLARLGNFPSMRTRPQVAAARGMLPLGLLAEELSASDHRTVPSRDGSIVLTDFQLALWTKLHQGRRVALTAPTSAGKSFILQMFLTSLFESDEARSVIYLVPTRALITQVSRAIRGGLTSRDPTRARPPEIATVPVERSLRPPARAIYVMTPERAQIMLATHAEFAASLVIVDEAQLLAEGSRGVRLHSAIDDLLERDRKAQVLFASPGVRNLDVFGRVLGLPDIAPIRSYEPTVAQNFVVVRVLDPNNGHIALHLVTGEDRREPIAELAIGRRTANRIDKLANISARLGRGATSLVYANGPADAEAVALAISKQLGPCAATPELQELARIAGETVHRDYVLRTCVRSGVAFHYSNMPTQLRLAIELAVVRGDIKYLVCTSTLLQGVNLPAKNIFMFRPEKGQHQPLRGADFWNLSGRAGRLLSEFQGTIFLIDYASWGSHPLRQPREASIVPAVDQGVLRTGPLVSLINRSPQKKPDDPNLEAVFIRLLGEHRNGSLQSTIDRIGRDYQVPPRQMNTIIGALSIASTTIRLPQAILRQSSDISAHKQQLLYDHLRQVASASKSVASSLIPKRPSEDGAYDSYASALQACHRILLGLGTDSRLHRFHALVALWWMGGRALPQIVQNQIARHPHSDKRRTIRLTLELVEKDIRYQCVRLFSCYNAILAQVLHDLDFSDLAERMPDVPLYLELGAAVRTTISLISLGISRPAAKQLTQEAPSPNMDVAAVLLWLSDTPSVVSELPPTARDEVEGVLNTGYTLQ